MLENNTVSNENEERVRAWSGIEICILQWLAFVNSFSNGGMVGQRKTIHAVYVILQWRTLEKCGLSSNIVKQGNHHNIQCATGQRNWKCSSAKNPNSKFVVHNANKTNIIWCFRKTKRHRCIQSTRGAFTRIHKNIQMHIWKWILDSHLLLTKWSTNVTTNSLWLYAYAGNALQCINKFILLRNTHHTYVRWNEH